MADWRDCKCPAGGSIVPGRSLKQLSEELFEKDSFINIFIIISRVVVVVLWSAQGEFDQFYVPYLDYILTVKQLINIIIDCLFWSIKIIVFSRLYVTVKLLNVVWS